MRSKLLAVGTTLMLGTGLGGLAFAAVREIRPGPSTVPAGTASPVADPCSDPTSFAPQCVTVVTVPMTVPAAVPAPARLGVSPDRFRNDAARARAGARAGEHRDQGRTDDSRTDDSRADDSRTGR